MAKQMSKEGYAKLEKELDYLKSIFVARVRRTMCG